MITQYKPSVKSIRTIRVKYNERHLWKLFHPYHYMTADAEIDKSLPQGAAFFTFYLYTDGKEELFACIGVIPQVAKVPARRFTRVVVLPEFQGMGLAGRCIDTLAEYYHKRGVKIYSATFHPKLGEYRERSELWEASSMNLKAHKTSDNFENLGAHSGLRDGVAMYRHGYASSMFPPKFRLMYDILELTSLKSQRQKAEKGDKPELTKKIRILEDQIKQIEYASLSDGISEHEAEEAKIQHKKMFKTKRKKLTPEERRKLKDAKTREVKNQD